MVSQSELEREKYEARLKYQRDAEGLLREATERGIMMGRVQMSEEILKLEPTPRETLLSMPLEELRQLVNRLKAQLASRG